MATKLVLGEVYYKGDKPYVYQGDVAGVLQFQNAEGTLGVIAGNGWEDSLTLEATPDVEAPKTVKGK